MTPESLPNDELLDLSITEARALEARAAKKSRVQANQSAARQERIAAERAQCDSIGSRVSAAGVHILFTVVGRLQKGQYFLVGT